ncbi:sugar 3,4-ketoisomerase [Adlercreutzia murintestinalis]|uniref:sugar 3,4-ketoisomerase n=1 Tax=Adlercreutzia murintestinalis TaxID=2941325 RepID=UPI00203CCFD5|nr:FdtA/QdtA family cupin domain-containing protein [Adlercreutzia murintestinalis]
MLDIETLKFDPRGDGRGFLVPLEGSQDIPFNIERIYYIGDVPEGVTRGAHAHKDLEQVLICVHGSCTILLDDGYEKTTIELTDPFTGILLHSMIWREMYNFSPDCVLLVLASKHYSEDDYIRDYDTFLDQIGVRR